MSTQENHLLTQWHADLARIAAQIDDLRGRVAAESQMLYTNLSAEIAALQAELKKLEAEVNAASPDAYAKQIAAQIDELRAKGDAAYNLLHRGLAAQLDLTDTEIRQLEIAAMSASGEARAQIMARIDELKSARTATQTSEYSGDQPSHGDDPAH
jgi:predicted  nucleic acid-binding Zn-ribbon protein